MLTRIWKSIRRRVLRKISPEIALLSEARGSLMTSQAAYKNDIIGEWSYGSPRILRWRPEQKLEIGKFCSIAEGVEILLGGEHRRDFVSTYPFGNFLDAKFYNLHEWSRGNVRIGHDVWIGRGATILSGVTIGNGAIIGAGSVVSTDIPPYTVAAGNPVRILRNRFPEDVTDSLLRIEWWNWPIEKVRDEIQHLMSTDLTDFILRHDKK